MKETASTLAGLCAVEEYEELRKAELCSFKHDIYNRSMKSMNMHA